MRFLARLPRHGHFHASVMDDEDAVAALQAEPDGPSAFGMQGWTYERELLTTVVDVLGQLHASFIQANSDDGKRPKVEPMLRPRTALDRMRSRQVLEEHRNLVRLLRPQS